MDHDLLFTRRQLLRRSGMGFGMLGLTSLLADNGLLAADTPPASNPLAPRKPHFPAKARRVVHLFMNGGPAHVDTFDPKPLLEKYHGQPLPNPNLRTARTDGFPMPARWFYAVATTPCLP